MRRAVTLAKSPCRLYGANRFGFAGIAAVGRSLFTLHDKFFCDACRKHVAESPSHVGGLDAVLALEHLSSVHADDLDCAVLPSHVASMVYHALTVQTSASESAARTPHLILVERFRAHYFPSLALALHRLVSPLCVSRDPHGGRTLLCAFVHRDSASRYQTRLRRLLIDTPTPPLGDVAAPPPVDVRREEIDRRTALIEAARAVTDGPAAAAAAAAAIRQPCHSCGEPGCVWAHPSDIVMDTRAPLNSEQVTSEMGCRSLSHDPQRRSLHVAVLQCPGGSDAEHTWHYTVDLLSRILQLEHLRLGAAAGQSRDDSFQQQKGTIGKMHITVLCSTTDFAANIDALYGADCHSIVRTALCRYAPRAS